MMGALIALQLAAVDVTTVAARVVGMAVLAGALAGLVAVAYRWYADERVQEGLTALIGLAGVAVYLNTTTALGRAIGGSAGLFDLEGALINVATFVLAGLATQVGRTAGDRLAIESSVVSGRRRLPTDVSRLVQSVGRVTSVKLPDEVEDIEGYDPVDRETKAALARSTLLFPRGLTVEELRDRLRSRLAEDHGIGHVDVELTDDGRVEYLAVGSRAAGLGPTLAPGTAALAVKADPAYSASSGDAVELWLDHDAPERVAVGELRARAGDVVTVAMETDEALGLDPEPRYRLVTRPAGHRPDREFASLLRVADETMAAIEISEGSALAGTPLADLSVTVVAVQPAEGALVAVPQRSRTFVAGDVVYAVGAPEALRGLEAAAAPPEPEPSS